jgi:hypothetical protein
VQREGRGTATFSDFRCAYTAIVYSSRDVLVLYQVLLRNFLLENRGNERPTVKMDDKIVVVVVGCVGCQCAVSLSPFCSVQFWICFGSG